jgi:hypothetical protein
MIKRDHQRDQIFQQVLRELHLWVHLIEAEVEAVTEEEEVVIIHTAEEAVAGTK